MGRAARIAGALALALWFTAPPALAVFAEPPLADPVQEARAREIMQDLRCLVCQNQSISDSNAPLARDLRMLVRERIGGGDSDAEAVAFIVDRYGDWVLLDPPFKATTWALWAGPALVLLAAAFGVRAYHRRNTRAAAVPAPLSAAERDRRARRIDRADDAPGDG